MTMPTERVRAIRSGNRLLETLLLDTELPLHVLRAAMALAPHYPAEEDLSQLLAENARNFPEAWVRPLSAAGELFGVIWSEKLGSAKTQEAAHHVLRHYPDEPTLRSLPSSLWLGQWLQSPHPVRPPAHREDVQVWVHETDQGPRQPLEPYESDVWLVEEPPQLGLVYVQDAHGARFALDGHTDVRTELLIGTRYRALVTTDGTVVRLSRLSRET